MPSGQGGGIGTSVSLCRLFAMLFALTIIAAPLAMPAGAEAAIPAAASHHGDITKQGHCDGEPAQDHHGKAADKGCCTAMCMAVAVAPAAAVEPLHYGASTLRPGAAPFRRGYLGEIATPPPRLS